MEIKNLFASPKALGFDVERLRRVDTLLERGLADKLYTAAVYLVLRHGMIAAHGTFGVAQPEANPPLPARLDTLFDMASVTKTMTATMILQCVEEGRFQLGSRVGDILPEAEKTPVGAVTVRQLATHTSGLPAWKAVYQTKLGSTLAEILATPLKAEPGAEYTYSDLGYILLGEILAHVLGKPLEKLAQERLFTPCGMTRSGYKPDAALYPFMAATAPGERGIGKVHDPNAYGMGGVAGHAGLFADALDMARFALAFRHTSTAAHLNLPALLGLPTRHLAERSQIDPKVGSHSIGWFTPPNGYLPHGDLLSDRTFGHTGFTGTLLMFDPEYDLILLLLTNRVYEQNDGTAFLRLRRPFANVVAGAILS